jgi:hypothetical protein
LLQRLDDGAELEQVTVIYRPSFGRKGRPKPSSRSQSPRAEFGEFDALLGTPKAVYAIESKWGGSAEAGTTVLQLSDVQTHRHSVFRQYRKLWREFKPPTWQEFLRAAETKFLEVFGDKKNKMAPLGSKLANNLEFVLRTLDSCGDEVKDVVAYFHNDDWVPKSVRPETFRLVCLQYASIPPSGYFQLL